MVSTGAKTLYELFGLTPDCSFEELRTAYRRRAREVHPDVAGNRADSRSMVEINEAWRILSNIDLRQQYDASLNPRPQPVFAGVTGSGPRQPSPQAPHARRQAWARSVQGQILRIARLAGRSATQTLLIRHPLGARKEYDALVTKIVRGLCEDTESRMRAARAAGAAPLDLAVAATLIGIRTLADQLRRDAALSFSKETTMTAELLDRMWDILAHELPSQLTESLGGNPQVAKRIPAP